MLINLKIIFVKENTLNFKKNQEFEWKLKKTETKEIF